MKTINTKLDIHTSYPLNKPFTWEDVIFFDIETTGFSANTSYLYLIGCMYFKDNTWQITQWLADDMNSEASILEAFFQTIKTYKRLVHFNGSGFDIPFILRKCRQHHFENTFDTIESFDIYKKILPYKKLLPLPNYKLKTIEKFVGLNREDSFTGEDLIQVYANYLGRLQYEKLHQKIIDNQNAASKTNMDDVEFYKEKENPKVTSSGELSHILLLHNLEDVKGLLRVSDILYYADLFENRPWNNTSMEGKTIFKQCEQFTRRNVNEAKELPWRFQFTLPYTLPQPVSLLTPLPEIIAERNKNTKQPDKVLFFQLLVNGNQLTLDIPVYQGALKYFYDNYRDYFYLPKEDTAIHKSVAQYVDKEFKIKAKPSNCYIKKNSCFIPQTELIFTPFLKNSLTDKITYLEISNSGLQKSSRLYEYIKSILRYIATNKETKIMS